MWPGRGESDGCGRVADDRVSCLGYSTINARTWLARKKDSAVGSNVFSFSQP